MIEYAEGNRLDYYCDEENAQRLEAHEVLEICKQLIDALAHMKSRNIVHRDLKPENIILRQGLRPIIIDFGFAINLVDIPKELRHACGTPGFIAPEIYKK